MFIGPLIRIRVTMHISTNMLPRTGLNRISVLPLQGHLFSHRLTYLYILCSPRPPMELITVLTMYVCVY
jgi:hypothetical protein